MQCDANPDLTPQACFWMRAGLPEAVAPGGTSRVTTLPAPISASSPMLTPGNTGHRSDSAAALLRRYQTLEDALADGRFVAQAEDLRLYRRIATMDTTAPLPQLDDQIPPGAGRPAWRGMGNEPPGRTVE